MKKMGKGLAILIGGPKSSPEEEDMDSDETEAPIADEAKTSAVKDLYRALERKDVSAGVAALDSYMEACGYGGSDDKESEE